MFQLLQAVCRFSGMFLPHHQLLPVAGRAQSAGFLSPELPQRDSSGKW